MSITTGTGDNGMTTIGNERISKNSIASNLLGSIDELHVLLGKCSNIYNNYFDNEINIFNNLCAICLELGSKVHLKKLNKNKIYGDENDVNELMKYINYLENILPKQNKFLLFVNQCDDALIIHETRTKVRKVERLWTGMEFENGDIHSKILNKLSDFLHLFARYINLIHNNEEIYRNNVNSNISFVKFIDEDTIQTGKLYKFIIFMISLSILSFYLSLLSLIL